MAFCTDEHSVFAQAMISMNCKACCMNSIRLWVVDVRKQSVCVHSKDYHSATARESRHSGEPEIAMSGSLRLRFSLVAVPVPFAQAITVVTEAK